MAKEWWDYSLDEFTCDQLWEHYAKGLRYMDWYYHYADDSRSYNRGVKAKHYLMYMKSILENIDCDRANQMYNDARPIDL